MNKTQIIEKLKEYNFDPRKYIVISGAAMVLYGFKEETNDIDISVTKEYMKYLLKNYDCVIENKEKNAYMIDNVINFGTNYYKKRRNYINEIPTQKKEDLIELKKLLNREKDIIDLSKIISKMD